MNLRCSEIAYNTVNRTLYFRNKSGWARVPYIGMPSRDTFDGSHEQHKIYAINNSDDPYEYVKNIKTELGPDIFICKENAHEALKIAKLMEKHRTVFAIEDRPIGHFTSYEAEIPTIEGRSASMHQYKVLEYKI